MKLFSYKKIQIHVAVITLTVIVSVFAGTRVYAQIMTGIPVGGDAEIQITARVSGCGDNITQSNLGEQCDGSDLNSQSCQTLGFDSGSVSCRLSCIFETSDCNIDSSSISTGTRIRNTTGIFTDTVPNTNIVFNGSGEPESIFFVTTLDGYLVSTPIDGNGNFSVTVSQPRIGYYDFVFYTLSANGLFGPRTFGITIQPFTTTSINNILIDYNSFEDIPGEFVSIEIPIQEDIELFDDKTDILENPREDVANLDFPLDPELLNESLDILAENENISPEDIDMITEILGDQNGYEIKKIEYDNNRWRSTQSWLSENTYELSEWYPNVYISFMIPYWDFAYDLNGWFDKYQDPFNFNNTIKSLLQK